ncbi:SprT-like domain-containing protein [Lutibacter flavus]|uniref:SprT-like family protein n=1 Tax=Lutibacter flavus TaxID=691689 RepID=A0A238XVI2_9FLAO|nr:SprT-like domain-containing protein [Lutibacter flavus]SNR62344.1 SprT-like family protein [Lutibacter flavus]
MIKKLAKYLPENAVEYVDEIITEHPLEIKIVNERSTKHGDFKRTTNRRFQITINNNLNQYQFLLTLIHEIAHFVTFKQNNRVKPHGIEWKRNFQHLMLPFINPTIYPENILPLLANYLKNPKASTGSDVSLTYALKQFDENSEKSFIFEIACGSNFIFKNKIYKKGNLRRTRFECIELSSKRTYLFNQNAEIDKL